MRTITLSIIIALILSSQLVLASSSMSFGGCTAAVIRLEGMQDTDKGIFLTNGHCVNPSRFFSGRSPEDATRIVRDEKLLIDGLSFKDFDDLGRQLFGQKIIFATMNGIDLALIEAINSYAELETLGLPPMTVSRKAIQIGQELTFTSNYLQKEDSCVVEKKISQLNESIWIFKNAYRLQDDSSCKLIPGNSGTVGMQAGKAQAIVFTSYSGSSDLCSKNNPCEIDGVKKSSAQEGQSYVFDISVLYSCYDQDKRELNFDLQACLK